MTLLATPSGTRRTVILEESCEVWSDTRIPRVRSVGAADPTYGEASSGRRTVEVIRLGGIRVRRDLGAVLASP
jgi:hypothetical protein